MASLEDRKRNERQEASRNRNEVAGEERGE
jgi:hypothetical protein